MPAREYPVRHPPLPPGVPVHGVMLTVVYHRRHRMHAVIWIRRRRRELAHLPRGYVLHELPPLPAHARRRDHEGIDEHVGQFEVRCRDAVRVHLGEEVGILLVHARGEVGPRDGDAVHVPRGGEVGRSGGVVDPPRGLIDVLGRTGRVAGDGVEVEFPPLGAESVGLGVGIAVRYDVGLFVFVDRFPTGADERLAFVREVVGDGPEEEEVGIGQYYHVVGVFHFPLRRIAVDVAPAIVDEA
mmetsp:Transcript_9122/g.19671  ORF Transcript_9122/g.19671 Transcript_9122/m.19671 type:complete len:241 (+) Transcript_9122:294-1016(+)